MYTLVSIFQESTVGRTYIIILTKFEETSIDWIDSDRLHFTIHKQQTASNT